MASKQYPRRRNGSEYYPRGKKPFLVDPGGRERYARDKKGNEFYPQNKQFARDADFREYYARDCKNNEFYPHKRGLSRIIQTNDDYEMAKWANGMKRYPTDGKGNEYYLTRNGQPILIHQEDGKQYFAKNKRGNVQIPWNVLQDYVTDVESYVETRDALGNSVFICRHNDPKSSSNFICRCICELVTICPSVGRALAATVLS